MIETIWESVVMVLLYIGGISLAGAWARWMDRRTGNLEQENNECTE